tara:strand:+ start:580 stop:1068 length:489 start_codon:yes stop_codon:yes gene_type:complete
MKVIDKLSTYASLLGVISAIGGGFYAWGEFNNRISVLEKKPVVNLSSLKQKDKELTKQFDEVLLYANEYKVDLIDRIAKVEEKIKPVDLTLVFKEIAKVRESIAMLDIPVATNLNPVLQSIKALEKLITEAVKQVAIVSKENELQDIQIQEIKLQNKNPLGG